MLTFHRRNCSVFERRRHASKRQVLALDELHGLKLVAHPSSYFVWLPLAGLSFLAGAEVGELADRVSGALMEISGTVEVGGFFVDFYPQQFCARDLVGLLRNVMRSELGLKEVLDLESPRGGDWPWSSDLPEELEYIRRQTEIPGRPELTERERQRLRGASE